MEKLALDEFTRALMVVGACLLGTSALFLKLFSKVKGSFKAYVKQTLFYCLFSILVFASVGVVAYWTHLSNQHLFYLVFQSCFFFLGALHLLGMRKTIRWAGGGDSVYIEFVFTLILGLFGAIIYALVYQWVYPKGMALLMSSSVICFMLPILIDRTANKALMVPAKVFKSWKYPLNEPMGEPDEAKLKNLLVISFVIRKKVSDATPTHFRAKAPVDMELGELFYYFINDYNERHPDDKIIFTDQLGEPYGWLFFKRMPLYRSRLLDAEKSIYNNKVNENSVIECKRYNA